MSENVDELKRRLEEQADLVSGLIKHGAYDIAKQFIDFIKAKEPKKEEPKKESHHQ